MCLNERKTCSLSFLLRKAHGREGHRSDLHEKRICSEEFRENVSSLLAPWGSRLNSVSFYAL